MNKENKKKENTLKLIDVLAPSSIGIGENVNSWEDAVSLAGKYLMADDGIESRYISAMINAVKEIGPYMVVAPGIAIAHARPEDGAKKICISFVLLENAVEFGSKNNDPVDLIFGLSATDHDSHISILRDLAMLLKSKEAVEKLRACKSKDEVINIIQNFT